MRALISVLLLALLALPSAAQVPMTGAGRATPAGAGGGYTGPGDIVSGAKMWAGLRAYSSAKRGTAVANICNVSDVACADVNSDATTGSLPSTITIGGSDCSSVVCTVKILYDQSGALACTGAIACDLTLGTIANRPTLVASCSGALWCMNFARANTQSLGGPGFTSAIAAPHSLSVVAERTASFTTQQLIVLSAGDTCDINTDSATNSWFVYGGSVATFTASDSTFHALQVKCNGATSAGYIDGSNNVLNIGGGGSYAGPPTLGAVGGQSPDMRAMEVGVWSGDQSATFSSMNSNQHTYWGF